MLWPDGQINDKNGGFQNLGSLLKSGINAIKDCNKDTKVIIHTAFTQSDGAARWFYDGIKSVDVQWDITGLSYYCFVHGTIHNMQEVVADMKSRYSKPVIIAETSYVFEGGAGICVKDIQQHLSVRPTTFMMLRQPLVMVGLLVCSIGSRHGLT